MDDTLVLDASACVLATCQRTLGKNASDTRVTIPMKKLACTLAEATVITGLSRSSLYRAVGANKLSAKKFGRKTLLIVDELEALVAGLPDANIAKEGVE